MSNWTVPRLWPGEAAFIVAGGPSVLDQDTEALRGRRVIAINSSYQCVPFADYLMFSDLRWWDEHRNALAAFKGGIVAANAQVRERHVLCLKRKNAAGLSDDPSIVTVCWTTLTAAINFAVHLGVKQIVLLGADNKRAADGRCHHHTPHKWPHRDELMLKQREELGTLCAPLQARGVDVVNCSPGSALPFWPIMTLTEYLAGEAI